MDERERLEILRDAAWARYDVMARALPDCEHNQEWWKQGPGRPQPPDCEHNRPWRTEVKRRWRQCLWHIRRLDRLR